MYGKGMAAMVDEKRWRIIGKSVLGASHIKSGLPNQDAIAWKQKSDTGVPLVLSIADGHGSEKYFRSDIGAKFAVQVANEVLNRFEKGLTSSSLSSIEDDAKRLPLQIVSQWKQLVTDHWEKTPPNEREWKWLRENADALKAMKANPAIPYGATLLTLLLAELFILYFQLGDGDILTIAPGGDIAEPVPGDERNLANETTSLCDPQAARDFRTHFQRLGPEKPALIMLSTDGYTNSFSKREGFYKVGSDIWQTIYAGGEAGLKTVEDSLEGWLNQTSKTGSGDDITVGLLCRMNALNEEGPIITKRDTGELPGQAVPQKDRALAELPTTLNPTQVAPQGGIPAVKAVEISSLETVLPQATQPPGRKDIVMPQDAPAVKPPPRPELIVSQGRVDVPCYPTISGAIKAAPPGALIRVQPGQYHENLVLTKEVEIVGDGPRHAIVIESGTSCIQMQTDHALIQGITVQGKLNLAGSLQNFANSLRNSANPLLGLDKAAAIDIPRGQLELRDCVITSKSSSCMHIHGSANPIITHCDLSGGEKGLIFSGQARGRVEHCRISAHSKVVIEVLQEGHPLIKNCQITGNYYAIVVRNKGHVTVEDCSFTGQEE